MHAFMHARSHAWACTCMHAHTYTNTHITLVPRITIYYCSFTCILNKMQNFIVECRISWCDKLSIPFEIEKFCNCSPHYSKSIDRKLTKLYNNIFRSLFNLTEDAVHQKHLSIRNLFVLKQKCVKVFSFSLSESDNNLVKAIVSSKCFIYSSKINLSGMNPCTEFIL